MNLHAYFERYDTKHIAAVAKRAGTNLIYLQQCKYGTRRMSADLAVRLDHETGGELSAAELRPDLPWRPVYTASPPAVPRQEVTA